MNDPIISSDAISIKVTARFLILTIMLMLIYVTILLV